MTLRLVGVMLGSEDPKSLSDFYTRIFGAPSWEDGGFAGWWLGTAGLMVGPHSEVEGNNDTPGRVMWNLETPDVKAEFDRIKRLGAAVVREPYQPDPDSEDVWLATFEDPDGNYFQLASPMPGM